MRLIDADAKELKQRININFSAVARFIIKSILKDAPTIDAVPVVRCRECKHWRSVDERIEHMECNVFFWCYGRGYLTNADDFCSYGERKEENPCDHCMSGSYRGCDGCGYAEQKGGAVDG